MNLRTLAKSAAKIGYPIGSFFGGFKAGLSGKWEGSESSRFRNRPGRALESVDWGLNYGVREGMLSESRNLEQTFGIARRINRQYAKHVIGSMRIKWNTGVPAIDKAYSDAWWKWMPIADVQARHGFRKLSKIAVSRIIVDGRIFAQYDTRGDIFQIQGIEADRVSSDGIFNADRPGLVSGIYLDGNGRATAAKVWERTLYGTFQNPQDIPFVQLCHAFDADRIDSVSGYTAYHAVLNDVRDLKETLQAEQLASKKNSKIAMLIKSVLGGAQTIDPFSEGGGLQQGPGGQPNVQSLGDVADLYMLPGEDAKAFTSERPSGGWLELARICIRKIALALDLPFGVVWDMAGMPGPAVRFEIMQASRTFNEFLTDVMEPMWIRPVVGRWLAFEISKGRLPFHPMWYNFTVPKPKSITIDFGRDSKASIAENVAGLGTATDWYAEEDQEFESQTDRLVYEARYRECARRGIPFDPTIEIPLEQIRLITPNGNPNQSDPGLDGSEESEETDSNEKPELANAK